MSSARFSRQTRFAPFGETGQARLGAATIGVVGLGGLGSWIADHLARAGAGTLRLIDRDIVEESNLPRQALYTAHDAATGRPKAECAAERLTAIGGPTRLLPIVRELAARNVDALLGGCDLVLDGLDHFAGRFLLNDWAKRARVPWIYGGAVGGAGSVLLIRPDSGPCIRCLFPGAEYAVGSETCDTVGVLTPLPALIAALQVSEAMRFFAGDERPSRLWHVEPLEGRALALKPGPTSPDCPVCSGRGFPALEAGGSEGAAKLCGRDTVQIEPAVDGAINLAAMAERWNGLGAVERGPFLVRLRRDGLVLSLFDDGRALIQGTSSLEVARAAYARSVGC